jgi:cytoskeletal protein RodZ
VKESELRELERNIAERENDIEKQASLLTSREKALARKQRLAYGILVVGLVLILGAVWILGRAKAKTRQTSSESKPPSSAGRRTNDAEDRKVRRATVRSTKKAPPKNRETS